jgi:hypothetical protein
MNRFTSDLTPKAHLIIEDVHNSALVLDVDKPIATAKQVEAVLGIPDHDLLAKIDIPSASFNLGVVNSVYFQSFYLLRNSQEAYDITPHAQGWPKSFMDFATKRPTGTVEVINHLEMQKLEDAECRHSNVHGFVYKPGMTAKFGRLEPIGGGNGANGLGQLASRHHLSVDVSLSRVEVIDTSSAGTRVTFAR